MAIAADFDRVYTIGSGIFLKLVLIDFIGLELRVIFTSFHKF